MTHETAIDVEKMQRAFQLEYCRHKYLNKFIELERVQLNTPVITELWHIYRVDRNNYNEDNVGVFGSCRERNVIDYFSLQELERKLVRILPEHEQIIEYLKYDGVKDIRWYTVNRNK